MKNKKEFIIGLILILIGFLSGINTNLNSTPILVRILKSIKVSGVVLCYAGLVWLIIYYIGFKKILQSFGKQIKSEKQKIFLLVIVIFLINLISASYIFVEKTYKSLLNDIRAIYVYTDNSTIDFKWNGSPKVRGNAVLTVENVSNKNIETHIKITIPEYLKNEIIEKEVIFKNEYGELKTFIIPPKSKERLLLDFYVSAIDKEKFSRAYTDKFEFTFFNNERQVEFHSE